MKELTLADGKALDKYGTYREYKHEYLLAHLLEDLSKEENSILVVKAKTDPNAQITLTEIWEDFSKDRNLLDKYRRMFQIWDIHRRDKGRPSLAELRIDSIFEMRMEMNISWVLSNHGYGVPKRLKSGGFHKSHKVYSLNNKNYVFNAEQEAKISDTLSVSNTTKSTGRNKIKPRRKVSMKDTTKSVDRNMSDEELFLAYINALRAEADRRGFNLG